MRIVNNIKPRLNDDSKVVFKEIHGEILYDKKGKPVAIKHEALPPGTISATVAKNAKGKLVLTIKKNLPPAEQNVLAAGAPNPGATTAAPPPALGPRQADEMMKQIEKVAEEYGKAAATNLLSELLEAIPSLAQQSDENKDRLDHILNDFQNKVKDELKALLMTSFPEKGVDRAIKHAADMVVDAVTEYTEKLAGQKPAVANVAQPADRGAAPAGGQPKSPQNDLSNGPKIGAHRLKKPEGTDVKPHGIGLDDEIESILADADSLDPLAPDFEKSVLGGSFSDFPSKKADAVQNHGLANSRPPAEKPNLQTRLNELNMSMEYQTARQNAQIEAGKLATTLRKGSIDSSTIPREMDNKMKAYMAKNENVSQADLRKFIKTLSSEAVSAFMTSSLLD
jgi:hypothetical protein